MRFDKIGVKNGIRYVMPQNYAKTKVDSYDFLPLEKILSFQTLSYDAVHKCTYSEFFWFVFSRIRTRKIPNKNTFHAVTY